MPDSDPTSSADMASTWHQTRARTYHIQKGQNAFSKHRFVQFSWLKYDKMANNMIMASIMHCIYCKECSQSMTENSAFAVRALTFQIETLKKHNVSKKHVLCRDRCTAGRATPLPAAFQCQAQRKKWLESIIAAPKGAFNHFGHIYIMCWCIWMKKWGTQMHPQ